MPDQQIMDTRRHIGKRRSQRLDLSVPVIVFRPQNQGPRFYESTQTLVVSAHGALIPLADKVALDQRLCVQNTKSGEQQECRVVSVTKEMIGLPRVAVEFTRPAPKFWRVAYPPADWNYLS